MIERGSGHRIEGRTKVEGAARYVDDLRDNEIGFSFDVAVPVTSRIARGRIKKVDASAAMAVPGVRLVMTHGNAPRLRKATALSMAETGELRPLQDDKVRYHGQCVAVVVAETLGAAMDGARLLDIEYEAADTAGVFTLADADARLTFVKRAGIAPGRIRKGDARSDYDRAPVKVDAEYLTAPHHHNAIEPSAVIARWDPDGGVTIHAAVQWHHIDALAIGQAFGLGLADRLPGFLARKALGHAFGGKVRLTNHLAGGAFGRNLNTIHLFLACMAAKVAGRAVKVVLTRAQTFSLLSSRAEVRQRLRLGADQDGRLVTMIQEPDVGVGAAGAYVEPVGAWPCQVYAHRSHLVRHRVARLDLNGSGWMRAPGGSSGLFALESAMDELAHKLGIDPLDLRLKNHAESDPESGKPWTSKALDACYEEGAQAIGWRSRPRGGTVRSDGRVVGYGMATAYEACFRFPASASVTLRRDGSALVRATVAEMGQGVWTGLRALSAEAMGLGPERIELKTDTTDLPSGAGSIASTGTFSNATAIAKAADAVKKDLVRFAVRDKPSPLYGSDPASIAIDDGVLRGPGNLTESIAELMRRHPEGEITKSGTTGRDFGRSKTKKSTFGAIFVEIALDPLTRVLSVERIVGAFDCGRIVEPTLARSQLAGGMIWGIGQALYEETEVDRRSGAWLNANLAEALISTNADIRSVEVITVGGYPTEGDTPPMKGAAEIGVIGPAPAIANAIFDAIGVRLRALPLRLEDRLAGEPSASDPAEETPP